MYVTDLTDGNKTLKEGEVAVPVAVRGRGNCKAGFPDTDPHHTVHAPTRQAQQARHHG